MTLPNLLTVIAVAANAAAFVYFLLLIRKLRRLNMLLAGICADAHGKQHLPIWVPWAAAFGLEIKLDVKPRERGRN